MSDVTRILSQIDAGNPAAAELLLPLVYDELRKLAAAKLVHEKPGQTLQATALVHEAYLRLVKPGVGSRESEVRLQRSEVRVREKSIGPTPDPRLPTPGIPAANSSPRRPRPCGGFSWNGRGAKAACGTGVVANVSIWTANWKWMTTQMTT
jgi:hypothetical protein